MWFVGAGGFAAPKLFDALLIADGKVERHNYFEGFVQAAATLWILFCGGYTENVLRGGVFGEFVRALWSSTCQSENFLEHVVFICIPLIFKIYA